jgi:hypothetical protein
MWTYNHPQLLADVLAAIFAITAIVDMAGTLNIYARSRRWRYLRHFYRVMCVLQLFTALLLAVSQLRIWGIIFAGFITSFRIAILRNHRQRSLAGASTRSAPTPIPPFPPAYKASSSA